MRTKILALGAFLAAASGAYGAYAHNRQQEIKAQVKALTGGGDSDRAPDLIVHYGCAGCHTIPGVQRANGRVGPSLRGLAGRIYIGGVLPNSPNHLVRWIVNPRIVSPKTAMPVTGISEREARHVAAYLLTLR